MREYTVQYVTSHPGQLGLASPWWKHNEYMEAKQYILSQCHY